MQLPKFTRREFCVQSLQNVSLAALVSSIAGGAGCGGSSSSPTSPSPPPPSSSNALQILNGTVSGGTVMVTIGAGSPLASAGNAALVRSSSGSFLVARTGGDTFTALTAICTHQGCEVTNFVNGVYECPCHGSRYSTSGAVVRGPAPNPLRQFDARFANNVLTITL